MTAFALGIDVGTSGVRSAVLSRDGTVLSMAREAHEPQDLDLIDASAWWRAVQRCLRSQTDALIAAGHDPRAIERIAVDGTSGSMVFTNEAIEPVTPALMYDSKGFHHEAQRIDAVAPALHIGKGSASALARALRLQREDDAGQAHHLMHQADFIAAKLMGRGGYSDHGNALKTGFDPAGAEWPDWYADLDLRHALLPQVKPVGAPLHPLDTTVANDLRLSSQAVVHAGTTDSVAAFLACAPMREGAAVTSLGTTLAVKILSHRRIDDPAIGLYAHRVGNYWLNGGASNTGGGVLKALFGEADLEALSSLIDPAVRSPLDYYPLSRPGERFPINDPELEPRLAPRPADDADFLHGVLESIARIEARCYAEIADRGGGKPTLLFTAGGGASNDTWTKIRERVLHLPIQSTSQTEAAVGVANLLLPQNK
ncbi:MAG: FGGY-family carbohydrate kinase [Pseudomonadota bacterium]